MTVTLPVVKTTTADRADTPAGKTIGSLLGDRVPAGPPVRLSESPLWDRQRRFYDRGAADIWGSGTVPHGITGNPRIANTYARLVRELLRSADGSGTPPQGSGQADVPHVIEIGGGSGRFAYLCVRALLDLLPGTPFVYVVTDFAPERVAGWVEHPTFRPLIDQGVIDFAVLDADRLDAPLELVVSGRTLEPASLHGPVVGIANYVFDTLRHDCYAVRAGEVREVRVAVTEPAPGVAGAEPQLEWESAPLGAVADDLGPVLAAYGELLDDTAVLAPVGGLRCLSYLEALTTGPSFAVVADKGHATTLELCSHEAPSVVYHGSAFSLMVNFDFLRRWVERRGGVGILPAEPARSLVVGAFALGPVTDPAALTAYVRDELLDLGPDNFYSVRPVLGPAVRESLDAILAGLRISRFDPTLLVELLPTLLDVLPTVSESARGEVEQVLRRVWRAWFPIGEPIDLALCVGLLLSSIQRYPEAVELLERSVADHPDSAPAAFSMAVARRGMRDLAGAATWVDRALELDPTLAEARTLRAVLADDAAAREI